MERPPDRPDWSPPTGDPVAGPPVVWSDAVADPADPLDVAASPDAWLSPRLLLVLTLATAAVLVVTVVLALLYWLVPATEPLTLPHPAQV